MFRNCAITPRANLQWAKAKDRSFGKAQKIARSNCYWLFCRKNAPFTLREAKQEASKHPSASRCLEPNRVLVNSNEKCGGDWVHRSWEASIYAHQVQNSRPTPVCRESLGNCTEYCVNDFETLCIRFVIPTHARGSCFRIPWGSTTRRLEVSGGWPFFFGGGLKCLGIVGG